MDMLSTDVLIMHVLDPDMGRGIKDLKKGICRSKMRRLCARVQT